MVLRKDGMRNEHICENIDADWCMRDRMRSAGWCGNADGGDRDFDRIIFREAERR